MNKKMQMFDKDTSLALKGFAIQLMLFHHCFRKTRLFEGYDISFLPLSQEMAVNIAFSFKICVSIFAFISGYGLFQSYQTYKIQQRYTETDNTAARWIFARYIRSFSPYWFIWILWATISQLVDNRIERTFLLQNVQRGLLYAAIDFLGLSKLFGSPTLNDDWWYMSAAAVFILIIPLVFFLKEELYVAIAVAVVLPRVIFAGTQNGAFPGWSSVYSFISPFLTGCLFAKENLFNKPFLTSRDGVKRALWFLGELLLVLFGYKAFYRIPIEEFWEIHYCIFPLSVILFCVDFVVQFPYIRRLLKFLGKHSTNIYLTHGFIRSYYFTDFIYSFKSCWIIVLVLLGCSLIISIIFEGLKKICLYNAFFSHQCKRLLHG